MPPPLSSIRNFSIIAHIDHGKSTLADRLLELTGTVQPGKMRAQYLDQLELERERGITIKMAPVVMRYHLDGVEYRLQCIDTPGHVDFGYEVSRALYACEGAVLLVDATQGVQAQTLAHGLLAKKLGLRMIAAINKIDLKEAQVEETALQIEALLEVPEEIYLVSAKTGEGVPELLAAVVAKIPPPKPSPQQALQALVFDSRYDLYKGVLLSVRVFSGGIEPGQEILLFHAGQTYEVEEVGVFRPHAVPVPRLAEGEVGYVAAQIKDPQHVRVGDTLMQAEQKTTPLPGYEPAKPMVFCGLYPSEGESFEQLQSALERLHLEDSAFEYQKETAAALGVGYRAGFLGFLHMDIVQQRLEREYGVDLVITSASVPYEVVLKSGKEMRVHRPEEMPEMGEVASIREPMVEATIITPSDFVGAVIKLCESARGRLLDMSYPTKDRCIFRYQLPFAELVGDFYDRLKSVTSGYASFDYTFIAYAQDDLVRLDVLVGGERVEALSLIVHRDKAYRTGRALAEKLREQIPRHLFEIPIQAAIGSKVIARETIKPLRKNVLAKCYGGDVTRKRKLLEKQKEGKKRLKRVGQVDMPQEAFLSVFKLRME